MNLSLDTTAPTTSSGTFLPPDATELDKNAFMDLLVQQLKNQDPLEPMANEEFVSQLATFSELEEMEDLNQNVLNMTLLQQSNALLQQLTDSSALIDRAVTYIDPVSYEEQVGTVESVKIEDGIAQLNIDGKLVPLGNLLEVNATGSTGGAGSDDAGTGETTDTDNTEDN